MKYLKIVLVILIFFFVFKTSYAQRTSAPLEIFLATEDAAGETMVFNTASNTTPIWYPQDPHYIDTENWDNPTSIEISGNYSYDQIG